MNNIGIIITIIGTILTVFNTISAIRWKEGIIIIANK